MYGVMLVTGVTMGQKKLLPQVFSTQQEAEQFVHGGSDYHMCKVLVVVELKWPDVGGGENVEMEIC